MSNAKLPTRADAIRALAKLIRSKSNDCARLALEENPPTSQLDLSLLQEVRRTSGGAVEVRLVDRLKAMELMVRLLDEDSSAAEDFFAELDKAADK